MTKISNYESSKYDETYVSHGNGIFEKEDSWFISLSFQQEPELGEGNSPRSISQYPMDDILDRYGVWISDFYESLNRKSKDMCYLEFSSDDFQSIDSLREIIGKHVYNKEVTVNGTNGQILVIE